MAQQTYILKFPKNNYKLSLVIKNKVKKQLELRKAKKESRRNFPLVSA